MNAKGAKRNSISGRKGSITNQSTKTTSQATPSSTAAQSSSSTSQNSATPSGDSSTSPETFSETIPFHTPLVLTPVSQVKVGHRRMSRVPSGPEDSMAYDPMRNNPDGSLKTMYTIPNFSKSYSQAMQARYCRHSVQPPRDQELSIPEIFGKK